MFKYIQNFIQKLLFSSLDLVPRELLELDQYFRKYQGIDFEFITEEDVIIAKSKNFHYGSIITEARTTTELEEKIIDAILTAFEVPASYKKEADIYKKGSKAVTESSTYALA